MPHPAQGQEVRAGFLPGKIPPMVLVVPEVQCPLLSREATDLQTSDRVEKVDLAAAEVQCVDVAEEVAIPVAEVARVLPAVQVAEEVAPTMPEQTPTTKQDSKPATDTLPSLFPGLLV